MTYTLLPPIFLISVLVIFCSINIVPTRGQCLADQKTLLLETKNSLTFNHSLSTKLVRWNPVDDCCSWAGVECDVVGHVISLDLEFEEISGGIQNSASLFNLRYLEKLNLAWNKFSDVEIPREIGNLTRLRHLNLSEAGFSGQIPRQLSRLENLVSLDLSTRFAGIRPLKLENPNLKALVSNLRGLEELYLDSVNISAPGNEWCKDLSSSLPDLRILSLSGCHLSGPLHSSLANLHSLSVLQLDRNNLATEVPEFLTNFSKLETLSLQSCSLVGIFPEKIFHISTLKILEFSNNINLSGTLPRFPQGGSVRNINLGYTNFSGSLPNSISNFVNLSSLVLSNCNFFGPIPPSLSNLTELDMLDFSFNYFTGSIPPFHLLKKLTYIDFTSNSLTGSLSSSHFEGLTNLVYINLGHNLLTGNIPSSLFALPSLQKLILSHNKFQGQVDEFLNASASLLNTIELSSNRLNGTIPKFFFELDRLAVLSLSSNSFTGNFRLEMFKNPRLARLELSYNDLVIDSIEPPPLFPPITSLGLASCGLQKFPRILKNSSVIFLDLSSNQIKGEIPSWIWEMGDGSFNRLNLSYNLLTGFQKPYKIPHSLLILDLHSNRLQGELPIPPSASVYVDYSNNYFNHTLPHDIGRHLSFAAFFSVSNNSLTGSIPASICNATVLVVLDLSSNALTGSIPTCLPKENWSLGVLSLARNNLSGNIPDTFSVNCSLRTLDLNKNALQGNFPESLANCPFLEVLNVGNNKIEDMFPCMVNKDILRVLILTHNKFYGDIQCLGAIQGWSNLQIIDISVNNITGDMTRIPFSNWGAMENVNDGKKSDYDHIRFNFLDLNDFYYQDAVTVTVKGLELELTKIPIIFSAIDFSRNNFHGKIPETIGDLKSLYLLNLSHNALTGNIPASLGNMTQLGSLDLSTNSLTGKIPTEIASLTFLSVLNLSHNKLFGEIPTGRQLQTFSPVSYEGNVGLCGFPLNVSCNKIEVEGDSPSNLDDDDGEIEWEYVSAAVGFVVGLGSVIWMLLCYGRWRKIYFEKIDEIILKVFPIQKRKTKK